MVDMVGSVGVVEVPWTYVRSSQVRGPGAKSECVKPPSTPPRRCCCEGGEGDQCWYEGVKWVVATGDEAQGSGRRWYASDARYKA